MINKTDSFVSSWRVWYNDLSTKIDEYNSVDHDFSDLPDDGFQAMRLWYNDGRCRFISGNDYYFFVLIQVEQFLVRPMIPIKILLLDIQRSSLKGANTRQMI